MGVLGEALAIRRAAYGDRHALVGQAMLNQAVALRALKRVDEARALNEGALEIFREAYGEDHAFTWIALNNQALIHTALGDVARALDIHRTLYAQRRAKLGPDDARRVLEAGNAAARAAAEATMTDVRGAMGLG